MIIFTLHSVWTDHQMMINIVFGETLTFKYLHHQQAKMSLHKRY